VKLVQPGVRWPLAAALTAGVILGVTALAGAALLIVPGPDALAAAGLLGFIAVLAVAAGIWVGGREGSSAPWLGAVVALALASLFAEIWEIAPNFRGTGPGRALGVLLFLAEPGYLLGSVLAAAVLGRPPLERPRSAAVALAGAGIGLLLAGTYLVPRLPAGALFMGAAAVMAIAGWRQTRASPSGRRHGVHDRTILITGVGGAGQLGYALAESLAAAGARLVLADRSQEVEARARQLGEERAFGVAADLATEEGAAAVVRAALDRYGGLDGVVNAAGGLRVVSPLAETDAAAWEAEYRRNATTAHLVTRAALPPLRASRGAVVNLASPVVLRGAAESLGAYAAAKAAVVALTRTLAREEARHGVRVNAVAPGMIDTAQNRETAGADAGVSWVTREQVAHVIAFLLSDEASGVSGEVVHVLGEGV
jgi:3-oxoacyl-[acyl-carrier protein] reductase